MLKVFNKLLLPINNLLRFKSDNIDQDNHDDSSTSEDSQVEWGYFVDVEEKNEYLDKEVFKCEMKRIYKK